MPQAFGAGLGVSLLKTAAFTVLSAAAQAVLTGRPRVKLEPDLRTTVDTAAPWQVVYGKTRISGTIVWVEDTKLQANDNVLRTNVIIALACHKLNAVTKFYIDDEEVPMDENAGVFTPQAGNKFAGKISYEFLDSTQALGFGSLSVLSAVYNAADHRFEGHHMCYAQVVNDPSVFPRGVPNLTFEVEGKDDVFDPRDSMNKYTANAALVTLDYLTNTRFGQSADYATEFAEADWIAQANICDEPVPLDVGGTEPRYEINGAFRVDSSIREILEGMRSAYAGTLVCINGKWVIRVGAFRPASLTITDDDLAGEVLVQTLLSRRDLKNAFRGMHPSIDRQYNRVEYPPVTNTLYETQDQGRIDGDLDLPFTVSKSAAQRIAKIELERTRQQISVDMKLKLGAYRVQHGDTVLLELPAFGFSAKPFQVVNLRLSEMNSGERGAVNPVTVDLGLRETASGVYDWNSGEETTVDLAPNTDLEDIHSVADPSGLILTSDASTAIPLQDETWAPRICVEWTPSTSKAVSHYEISYRDQAEAIERWTRRADFFFDDIDTASDDPFTYIGEVTDQHTYTVRVRAVNRYGAVSRWISASVTVDTLRVAGSPVNMVYGGDGNIANAWNKSDTVYTQLDADAETEAEWTDTANAQDGDTGTSATASPSSGQTLTAIWTFPGTGSIEGFFEILGTQAQGAFNRSVISYSLDGGSNFTTITGGLKGNSPKTIRSAIVSGNREDFQLKVEATKTGGSGSALTRVYIAAFQFVGASGVLAQVGNNEFSVRGDGTLFGEIWRAFPDRAGVDDTVVFRQGSARAVSHIWAKADATPTDDLQLILKDSVTGTVWPLIFIPKEDISTTDWYSFRDLFEPGSDVVGELDIFIRTRSTATIRCRRVQVNRGNQSFPFSVNPLEGNYQPDASEGEVVGYPPGPHTPGTPIRSAVA